MLMRQMPIMLLLVAWQGTAFASDVSVTVNIGDPRYYGRIDVDGYPPPQLAYSEPVMVARPAREVVREPLYVRVPPGHAKHWDKHCRQYNACNRPVYFVRDDWYRTVYAPAYVETHGKGHKQKHGKDADKQDRKEAKREAKEHKHGD
ncbi:MAG: hypothetical protein M3Z31_12125 [Pseudomonadota bacterium]|nr:hypothetical protein [Pseudomonadota bacterium]